MAASSSSSPPPGDGPRWSRGFRNTWRTVSDWGEQVERRHFDGDLAGSLARVVDSVADSADNALQTVTDWGDVIEQKASTGDLLGSVTRALIGNDAPRMRWQYSSPDGWPIDARLGPSIDGARTTNRLESGEYFWVTEERSGDDGVLYLRLGDGRGWLFDQKPGVGVLCSRAPLDSARLTASSSSVPATAPATNAPIAAGELHPQLAGSAPVQPLCSPAGTQLQLLQDEVARLEKTLSTEQEQHRGRVEAIRSLETALPRLREELAEAAAWKPDDESQELRSEDLRAQALEKAYIELQERHHLLLSRRAKNEADLVRFAIAARKDEAAELARAGAIAAGGQAAREWARDGPMTDALKNGKIELAEALGLIDETRLQSRTELKRLQSQLDVLHRENEFLRRSGEAYVAPQGSIIKSVRRLFSVARGKGDPFPNAEDAVT